MAMRAIINLFKSIMKAKQSTTYAYLGEVVHSPDLYSTIHRTREKKWVSAVDLESGDRTTVTMKYMDLCEHDSIPYLQQTTVHTFKLCGILKNTAVSNLHITYDNQDERKFLTLICPSPPPVKKYSLCL